MDDWFTEHVYVGSLREIPVGVIFSSTLGGSGFEGRGWLDAKSLPRFLLSTSIAPASIFINLYVRPIKREC